MGILNGNSAAKIVHSLLKEGLSPDDAYRKLINYYGLSDSKARLTVEVALNEAEYIRNAENKSAFI